MKGTRFLKPACWLLCALMLVGQLTVLTSAADSSTTSSTTSTSLADIKEMLNADSYEDYQAKHSDAKRATQTVNVDVYGEGSYTATGDGFKIVEHDGITGLYTPGTGSVDWTVDIPEDGLYAIKIEYYPEEGRTTSIERILMINDDVPFSEARSLTLMKNWENQYQQAQVSPDRNQTAEELKAEAVEAGFADAAVEDGKVVFAAPACMTAAMSTFCDEHLVRYFQLDILNNELRPVSKQSPKWMTYYLRDSSGSIAENFEFYFEKGENKITLEGKNEPMTIASITLYPLEDVVTYEEYSKKYADKPAGQDTIRLEAEFFTAASNITLYPVEDRSNALNSPSDVTRTVLNTVGGDKWQTAGQWIELTFSVSTAGMYDIVSRFKQDVLDGMSVCRAMYIYSDGLNEGDDGYYNGVPFVEARELMYNYNSSWQVSRLNSGTDENYVVYLAADTVYTVRLEVTLGAMGDVVSEVSDILTHINDDYLNIIKLTGASPDKYQDYGFTETMPDTMVDMVKQARRLTALAEELTEIAGEKSSNVATLEKIARLLEEMGTDDDDVVKNLSSLKTNIGTLGTFLSDAQTQPLQLDYIQIQPAGSKTPRANPNFFQAFAHEMKGFWQSFFRDYNSMGALEEDSTESVEVWLASARDQTQVLRNLINNDYTPNSSISVDLKLVAGGTLLPSILAESGPDVYLGLGQGDVINYAIRSALISIEGFDDFEETTENFTDAAMLVLGMEDADAVMHYYGLPETQSFPMMFVRLDVLADLDLEVPTTWDELMACIPTLQANNMQIGLTTDYKIFLYQNGGDLFADYGMRINLDSQVGLAAFEKMCNLFTMYSFPYQYDASNRFRTGEMPIIIGDYTGVYNQLKVFATEIEGKWQFLPLPGETDENGNINNVSISSVSASVMVKGCTNRERAWSFMKWYTGESCQVSFANEMVAILGPSAKQATANRSALASLPWTTDEYAQVSAQFENLASVPNYPGSYIIDRYTNFAFLSAFNDNANPSEALLQYISTINKEIERKRDEFNLETLTDGKDEYKNLITKRKAQMDYMQTAIKQNKDYSSSYDALLEQIDAAVKSDNEAKLMAARDAVQAAYEALDPDGSLFKADRIATMGYDMEDTTLTKQEKKKVRKCFSYEVYKNTSELYTQFKCCVDFLNDIIDLSAANQ